MGYTSDLDTEFEHEGWVVMTLADGTRSSGTSVAAGFYLDGYTFLPGDRAEIDPSFLRPWSDGAGWLPVCECGWVGVIHHLEPDENLGETREPSDREEDLLMGQWRIHVRETFTPST